MSKYNQTQIYIKEFNAQLNVAFVENLSFISKLI